MATEGTYGHNGGYGLITLKFVNPFVEDQYYTELPAPDCFRVNTARRRPTSSTRRSRHTTCKTNPEHTRNANWPTAVNPSYALYCEETLRSHNLKQSKTKITSSTFM